MTCVDRNTAVALDLIKRLGPFARGDQHVFDVLAACLDSAWLAGWEAATTAAARDPVPSQPAKRPAITAA